jgi:hypothetical protein
MREATEFIKKILAELPGEYLFDVIYSRSVDQWYEKSGLWEETGAEVLDCLLDLDAQQGAMYLEKGEEPYWDWADIELDEIQEAFVTFSKSEEELCINAGEGVMVMYDDNFERFPIVVVKKSFFDKLTKSGIEKLLVEDKTDYTAKISPAVYVEVVNDDDEE